MHWCQLSLCTDVCHCISTECAMAGDYGVHWGWLSPVCTNNCHTMGLFWEGSLPSGWSSFRTDMVHEYMMMQFVTYSPILLLMGSFSAPFLCFWDIPVDVSMCSLCTSGPECTLECLSLRTLSCEITCYSHCHLLSYFGRCCLPIPLSLASFECLCGWLSAMLRVLMTFDVYKVILGLTRLDLICSECSLCDGLGHSEVGLCLAPLGWSCWVWSASVACFVVIISVMVVPILGCKINIIHASSVCHSISGRVVFLKTKTLGAYS